MWKLGSDGNRIERNTSSSDAVEPSSNSVSDSELVSKSLCDGFLAAESCSEGCDIASFRVQERWQVSAARIVPLSSSGQVLDKDALKDKGETVLVQVRYCKYARGYQQ